jgi:hypothetical protein
MKKVRDLFGGLGNQMFQHAYIYAQMKKGYVPDIYLQDESFFQEYKDDVKAIYAIGIQSINKISLHVRRGDYIDNPFYVDLNATDYYDRAMKLFPGEKFLVFCADRQQGSDDIGDMEWCKERFQGPQFEFFQGKDEIEDMNMMASCKGHIMANSSFSWWASYLGGGKVVAPKQWFSDGVERIRLPNEWIVI